MACHHKVTEWTGDPPRAGRIRTRMSAAHGVEDLDRAIAAFVEAGRDLGVI